MNVKHIKVNGFRGIKFLDWTLNGTMLGLVGPGDSTKTTILDAIEYALSPRWILPISDSDFYSGKPDAPILIEITVGQIPSELLKEDKFGLYIRGWGHDEYIIDEPDDECSQVLTVRLTITTDYEASWAVVTERHDDDKAISWRDRARLGVVRLGSEVNRDLAWGRGSSLSRLTGDLGVENVLAEAYRSAREAVSDEQLINLVEAAKTATKRAREIGATAEKDFRPALDSAAMSINIGALSLHEGSIPVRAAGLGTRRLVALAIQQAIVPDGAILLIDEIEHALEPHRIRRLIRHLRTSIASSDSNQADSDQHGQIITTTHSPITIVELNASEIRIVRSEKGETKILSPDQDLQGVIRFAPYALLGRRIVVCEGATEVGLCRGMENYWREKHSGESIACRGVVFVDGGGSHAPNRAYSLAGLGYIVAYFADSDRDINPSVSELTQAGIKVIHWDEYMSTEQRIFSDLPWELIQETFNLAIEEHEFDSVRDAVAFQLDCDPCSLTREVNSWINDNTDESKIRNALSEAALGSDNRPGWYKRIDKAERLAEIIIKGIPQINHTDLVKKLSALESWCYAR